MNKDKEEDDYAKFPHLKARAEYAKSIIPKLKHYREFVDYLNQTNVEGWGDNQFNRSFAWLLERAEPLNFYHTYAQWMLSTGRFDDLPLGDGVVQEIVEFQHVDIDSLHPQMRKKLEEEHLLEALTAPS